MVADRDPKRDAEDDTGKVKHSPTTGGTGAPALLLVGFDGVAEIGVLRDVSDRKSN